MTALLKLTLISRQGDKSQSPLSKSSTPSPSHREALTPGATGAPGAPGPSTSCLRLVSKAATSADPLGKTSRKELHVQAYFNLNSQEKLLLPYWTVFIFKFKFYIYNIDINPPLKNEDFYKYFQSML